MKLFNLRPGHVIWLAGMTGTLAALPYLLHGRSSGPGLLAAGVVILAASSLLLAAATWIGGRACAALGLATPWMDAVLAHRPWPVNVARDARQALLQGLAIGIGTVLLSTWLPAGGSAHPRPMPVPFELASTLFGGITEEIYLNWCFMPVSAVMLRALFGIGRDGATPFPPRLFWTANALAALALGLLHLPAALAGAPPTTGLLVRTLALYGAPGLAYGRLFRKSGFEMAVLAHLASDACLHLGQLAQSG